MVMQNGLFGDSPFRDILETEPRTAYFAQQNQWRTPNQKRYFQDQFSNILNQYQGQLGRQIMGGQMPTLRFEDYLRDQNPFQQSYQQATPRELGTQTGNFNPFTRWLIGR